MKKTFILTGISLLFIAFIFAISKPTKLNYKNEWNLVDSLAAQQLPESGLKKVDAIYNQAKSEKNSIQLIKAIVYKMRFTLEVDPDKSTQVIRDFESIATKETNPADKALLQSMTAELYEQYYSSQKWTIDARTEIAGTIPEDCKEWTRNIFVEKIRDLLHKSLSNSEALQKMPIDEYSELLNSLNDTLPLEPTLYDFLAHRQIDILQNLLATEVNFPVSEYNISDSTTNFTKDVDERRLEIEKVIINTYRNLYAFHRTKNNQSISLYNELQRLNFVHQYLANNKLYESALQQLLEEYKNKPESVEIIYLLANQYLALSNDSAVYKKKAYDICAQTISRFPDYKRINLLKNIMSNITQKTLNINHNQTVRPYQTVALSINERNFNQLTISVFKVNADAEKYFTFRQDYNNRNKPYPVRNLYKTYKTTLKSSPYFQNIDTTITIDAGDYGIYEVRTADSDNSEATETYFVVTDFSFITRSSQLYLQDLYVLDSKSGLPQANVTVKNFNYKWNGSGYDLKLQKIATSNKTGFLQLAYNQNYDQNILILERGADKYFCNALNFYYNIHVTNKEDNKPEVSIFTDRSLYRPGQTIYFKGIAYYKTKDKNSVSADEKMELVIYDVNRQKVGSKSVKTNEFGSFSGEFIIPSAGLNGNYTLSVGKYSKTVYVEEYKRPTFEVTLEKPENEIRFGENVTLTGVVKAYAGYQVANAKVKYRITRMPHRYCWWWNEPPKEIVSGESTSDENGNFSIAFIPQKDNLNNQSWRGTYYTYMISADVTDTKGETQKATQTISVGDKSLFIVSSVPKMLEKRNGIDISVYVETLNGKQISADIKYEVYQLEESDNYYERIEVIKLKNKNKISSGVYRTNDRRLKLNTSKWKSGQYRLVLTTIDKWGNEVKTENEFIVYSIKDKQPAVKSYVWLEKPAISCAVGENAVIRFGTSTANTMVLYEIMQDNRVVSRQWISVSNKILSIKIPFKETYGAGINVLFTFMKDGELFQSTVQITRKIELKKLTPNFSVFRNKLMPGENAEWTITIPEVKELHQPAEVLAGMYDTSLDAIRPHSWEFNPQYHDYLPVVPLWKEANTGYSNSYFSEDETAGYIPEWGINELNWFGLRFNYYTTPIRIRGTRSVVEDDVALLEVVESAAPNKVVGYAMTQKNKLQSTTDAVANLELSDAEPVSRPVQIRTNFNETAFFYPQLKTDENGQVKFSFTAPESLTRWNVKMLAHTKDLYFGMLDTTAVTQKDLMVQMNLPRFVRKSDTLMLSCNVVNLTDKSLTTQVNFELINPANELSIPLKTPSVQSITLAPNETKAVNWTITEFSALDLVVCKVIAQADNFSDGEQKYLPVLPDKVLITESQPLIIRSNQTRQFHFESLINNATKVDTKNLALEFSSNPAWYAVQALPTLSTPDENNAISLFTAFYANSLAGYIVNSNPRISKILDQWKNANNSKDALLSNLEKNQELKNMLLTETPWVMAAKNENEQKQRLALLFDLNMQKQQAEQYWSQLEKLQLPNGAFTWYAGMTESRYITQEIVLNVGRLSRLTGNLLNDKQQKVIDKAIQYLDLSISEDYNSLKKNNKNYLKENCVGNMQLFYLHARSEYPNVSIPDFAKEAVKYYTSQSEKYWTSFTLYGKAMMAIVVQRNGKQTLAQNILKSLKENALKTDEMGMYWAKNTSGYFWNERQVAVQAAIIEAFAEITKNTADIDELKIWLLKQKQTQQWDSPISSVDAVYALLLQGSDWLSAPNDVEISVGNELITPSVTQAGTGYFKISIPSDKVTSATGNITVSSVNQQNGSTSNVGWGAMYWQYVQDQSKVKNSQSGLKLTKQLFVKNGNTMVPIEQMNLKTGDKIVTRLVLTSDRNMEFIALKDLRAACFEPVDQLSETKWKERVSYYQTTKDASTQFFFNYLPKGTYVFEYELWINNAGHFTSGVASVQSMYAPEFVSYAGGESVDVK